MYVVIHETSAENLCKIIDANFLFKSSEIQKRKLNKGQGGQNRKLTKHPSISLTDPNFADKYDEVDAVYCRLFELETKIQTQFGDGNCILVFDGSVLKNNPFVLNTEENFGFQIAKNGQVGVSQFSGEPGLTITSYNNINLLNSYKFDPYSSEIAILNNIHLSYLKSVFVKKQYQSLDIIKKCHKKNIQIYTI